MFTLSKLLSAITQPLTWAIALLLLGLCLWRSRQVLARRVVWLGLLSVVFLGFQAVPDVGLRHLENAYAVPEVTSLHGVAGVVVLGGSFEHPRSFAAHGQVPLGDAAERMTESYALMQMHPGWTLVFSGGEGRLSHSGMSEADLARAWYSKMGLDQQRVLYESAARNTRENAVLVAELLGPRCQREKWVLMTSAFHMSRSVEEFNAAGCMVVPYPVDYRTGKVTPWLEYSMVTSLLHWQTLLHELLGRWVYRLTR